MFGIYNLSSPFRTKGSDYDVQVVVGSRLHALLSRLGTLKRDGLAVTFSLGKLDVWVLNQERPDPVSLALRENNRAMRSWDTSTAEAYRQWKQFVGHDKRNKACLAHLFGLDPRVYLD